MQTLSTIKTARLKGAFGYGSARAVVVAMVVVIHIGLALVLVDLSENMSANPSLPQSLQVSLFKAAPASKPDLPAPVKITDTQTKPPKKLAANPPDGAATSTTAEVFVDSPKGEAVAPMTELAASATATSPVPQDVIGASSDPVIPNEPVAQVLIKAPLYERPLLPINLPSLIKFVAYQGEIEKGAIEKGAVLGTSTYKIDATAEGYQASLDIRLNWLVRTLAGGNRAWGSRGLLSDEGLRPKQITEKRGDRPEKITDLDLGPGVQDRVSLIWQFGLLARTFPEKFVSGYEFDQPLRVASRVTNSRWRVLQENIAIQGISTTTLAFTRIDTRDDDFRFDCWLDVNERLLPVRLRITGKGYVLDMIKDSAK